MKKIIIGLVIALFLGSGFFFVTKFNQKKELEEERKEKLTLVTSHYNNYVVTNKKADLYLKEENYQKIGEISEGTELELEEITLNDNTNYFPIKNLDSEYYIKYEDVDKIDTLSMKNSRYQKYIPFNKNIITSDQVTFYQGDQVIFTFDKSFNLPIIIKEDDRYYVEYDNRLLEVKKEDVQEVVDQHNTDLVNSNGVGVLNYHFFYDETNKEDAAGCQEILCMPKTKFKEQLDYLKEENILTVTMQELEWYLDKKINLPKSILITIDDGARTQIAVDLLTEYQFNATIFLITAWFDPNTYYKTNYVELHSHGNDLHNNGVCPGGQGGAIKCVARNKLLADLNLSKEKLNGTTAFAYPFYEYNEYSISVLKEVGFTMGFIGKSSTTDNLAKPGSDKFRIRRFVMLNTTTIKKLDDYLSQIK